MSLQSLQSLDPKNLKCALCQNYLSVPPIIVISQDGKNHKCGRCYIIKTQVNTRNRFFEDIAKLVKFPCIYQNCKEELSWGSVESHEQICSYRTFRCNLLENCSDIIMVEHLESHYITKRHHRDGMVREQLQIPMKHSLRTYMLIKKEVPYLVYCDGTKHDFWIAVFSFKSKLTETAKYEVKLCTTESDMSVLYENRIVTPYKEREHCANCLYKECSLPHHKFSKVNEGKLAMVTYIQRTIIPISVVSKMLGTDEFICTVNIVDESGKSETNKSALVVKDLSHCNNNELFRQILQCPICLELMPAEIFTCKTGHVICNTCKPRLQACPTCGKRFAASRNYALEEIAENIEMACEHQKGGCNFIGNVTSICDHQTQCFYKKSK